MRRSPFHTVVAAISFPRMVNGAFPKHGIDPAAVF